MRSINRPPVRAPLSALSLRPFLRWRIVILSACSACSDRLLSHGAQDSRKNKAAPSVEAFQRAFQGSATTTECSAAVSASAGGSSSQSLGASPRLSRSEGHAGPPMRRRGQAEAGGTADDEAPGLCQSVWAAFPTAWRSECGVVHGGGIKGQSVTPFAFPLPPFAVP